MNDIYSINKQINAKIGADTGGATTFELVKAQVAKLGGDTSKVVDIYTGEQQVLEHIKPAGPDIVIQNSKDVSISANGTTVVSPDAGYDAIKDVIVDVNVAGGGGGDLFGFDAIGYDGTVQPIKDDVAYSKQIYDSWDPNTTSAEKKFYSDTKLVYMPNVDTSNVTNMQSMFDSCRSLTTLPMLDTSKVTNMNSLFYGCYELKTIPLFDTSKVTNMAGMCSYCKSLGTIPQLDTSNVTNMWYMFEYSTALTTIPQLDTSNVTIIERIFNSCTRLTTIPQLDTSCVKSLYRELYDCSALVNFGGFLNIGKSFTGTQTFELSRCYNLSNESIQNVIDGLYDMTAKGFSPTLKFHSTVYAKLTDAQKAQITAKNWTVTA